VSCASTTGERVTHPACASSASDASSVRMHVEGVRVRVGIEGMHVDMEVHGGVEAWVCMWWATAWARTCA
jgi:hypothetical protein